MRGGLARYSMSRWKWTSWGRLEPPDHDRRPDYVPDDVDLLETGQGLSAELLVYLAQDPGVVVVVWGDGPVSRGVCDRREVCRRLACGVDNQQYPRWFDGHMTSDHDSVKPRLTRRDLVPGSQGWETLAHGVKLVVMPLIAWEHPEKAWGSTNQQEELTI